MILVKTGIHRFPLFNYAGAGICKCPICAFNFLSLSIVLGWNSSFNLFHNCVI